MLLLVDWANDNQGLVTLVAACTTFVFSGVVAVATVWYARLTSRLVDETIRLRKVETEPDIAVYLDVNKRDRMDLDLVVRNIGRGPAHRASLEFTDPTFGGRSYFEEGVTVGDAIKYLPPDLEYRYLMANAIMFFQKPRVAPVAVSVVYENRLGERMTSGFVRDGGALERTWGGHDPEAQTAEGVARIASVLSQFNDRGWFRIKVQPKWRTPWHRRLKRCLTIWLRRDWAQIILKVIGRSDGNGA